MATEKILRVTKEIVVPVAIIVVYFEISQRRASIKVLTSGRRKTCIAHKDTVNKQGGREKTMICVTQSKSRDQE